MRRLTIALVAAVLTAGGVMAVRAARSPDEPAALVVRTELSPPTSVTSTTTTAAVAQPASSTFASSKVVNTDAAPSAV